MNKLSLIILCIVVCYSATFGQKDNLKNWHHKDPKKDKFQGISSNKAYQELLKGRTSKTVIVAIIDSGTDTTHEDLKGKFWVNKDEIPNNGIDDDNNGYIDDINGWNFLGNSKGENILHETLEITRVYNNLKTKFTNKDTTELDNNEKKEYEFYKKVTADFQKKYKKAKSDYDGFTLFSEYYTTANNNVKEELKKDDYTIDDLKNLSSSKNETIKNSALYLSQLYEKGFTKTEFNSFKRHVESQYKYRYNVDNNQRQIIGDDPTNKNDSVYGNNDIMGPSCGHGTSVAGIVAANRNNNNDAYGIADNVKVMILRVVPDGDERDKDVANAIKYAVNNGAQVVNMSFGKDYSPQKQMVDDALLLAEQKKVLLIHAAGNEAENSDIKWHYPTNSLDSNNIITKYWIEVGASSIKANKKLPAVFSNYGQQSVDVFAPGVRVYSLQPGNKYESADGTSSACPVVTGIAAMLMSYFPQFSPLEIKEIILNSSVPFKTLKVYLPDKSSKKTKKVKFGTLSKTGAVVNAYNAVKMAIEKVN